MQRIARGLRLRSDYTSTQTDLTKKIHLIRGSKVLELGHSVASEDIKVNKTGKKVPKDERRVMVEAYVIKYKEMNDGKFPSASEIKKQVGGGYYIIRNILQEMEYKSKAPHGNTVHESAWRKEASDVTAVTISHPNRKTLSEKVVKQKKTVDADDVNSAYSDVKSTRLQILKQDGNSCNIEKRKYDLEVETEEVVEHLHPEKRKHDGKDILTSEAAHPQRQQHKPSPGSNKLAIGNSEKQTNNEESPKQQSMWVNIKSLADGIMRMWKGL